MQRIEESERESSMLRFINLWRSSRSVGLSFDACLNWSARDARVSELILWGVAGLMEEWRGRCFIMARDETCFLKKGPRDVRKQR